MTSERRRKAPFSFMLRDVVRLRRRSASSQMQSSNSPRRTASASASAAAVPIAIAIVAVLLAGASSIDPRWHDVLDYRRVAVAGGQWWRLVTAHLMHLSVAHALLDIGGLLLVAWIFAAEFGWRTQVVVSLAGIVLVDAALWGLRIDRYVGLSGVLHAWFAAGSVTWLLASRSDGLRSQGRDLVRQKRLWGALLSLGLLAKLALELRDRAFWLDGDAFPVVTAAHRWGALAGVVSGLWIAARRHLAADGEDRASRGRRPRGSRAR